MAASESARSAPRAALAAEAVAALADADGVPPGPSGEVECSSAMPPTPRPMATTSTVTSSGIDVLLLRGRGSCGVTSLIFPALRSGHAGHDQARCLTGEV